MNGPLATQKKLEELVARYRLEPSIKDVFVEGKADTNVLMRFLRSQKLGTVAVYEVSSVEISARRLIAAGYADSAKERVVFLAHYFGENLCPESTAATCVVDRDYDLLLGKSFNCPFLLFWDHSCLEMYAFDPGHIDSLVRAIAPAVQKGGQAILAELTPLLLRLFAIRSTNIFLGLGLEWLDSFSDSCILSTQGIAFDEADFIRRYLSKNGRLADQSMFVSALQNITSKMTGDRRLFIRGHDFVVALCWYLRKITSKSSLFYRPEIIEELLMAYVEPARCLTEPFFEQLLARVSPAQK